MRHGFAAVAMAAACLVLSLPAAASATRLAALAEDTYQAQLDLEPLLETHRQGAGPRQGQLAISFSQDHRQRSRTAHRRTMGPRFDIRAFHDVILGQGHLPLSMLRERVSLWISAAAP